MSTHPSKWRCYKMMLLALEKLVCGESNYTRKIERLFDEGFSLKEVSDEAVPADCGWICDCGDWVDGNDHFHEVLEWKEW